jgi:hypothetical protein
VLTTASNTRVAIRKLPLPLPCTCSLRAQKRTQPVASPTTASAMVSGSALAVRGLLTTTLESRTYEVMGGKPLTIF